MAEAMLKVMSWAAKLLLAGTREKKTAELSRATREEYSLLDLETAEAPDLALAVKMAAMRPGIAERERVEEPDSAVLSGPVKAELKTGD